MAERNNERTRDKEQQNVNAGGGRKGGSMEENLQQMMGQVEAPKDAEAPKDYDNLSDWIEDTIKDPQVPTKEQLSRIGTIFGEQRDELPPEFETSKKLIEDFLDNAMNLLEEGKLEKLQADLKALSASLNEEMLKGDVDLLFMLKDFEKMGGL